MNVTIANIGVTVFALNCIILSGIALKYVFTSKQECESEEYKQTTAKIVNLAEYTFVGCNKH